MLHKAGTSYKCQPGLQGKRSWDWVEGGEKTPPPDPVKL